MKYLKYLCLCLGLLFCACQSEKIEIVGPQTPFWKDKLPLSTGIRRIFLNSTISENELRAISWAIYYRFDGSANEIVGTILYSPNTIYLRPVFGKNMIAYLAYTENRIFIQDAIQPLGNNGGVQIYFGPPYRPLFINYTGLNVEQQIGAFNQSQYFLTSVLQKDNPQLTTLVLMQIYRPYPQESRYYLEINESTFKEIVLPLESQNKVRWIESFKNNFFISTAESSYLIRQDGSFKKILEAPAIDFFEMDNKIIADLGTAMFISENDGESWTLLKDNLNLPYPREFAKVKDELICFKNDSLFLIDKNNFTHQRIDNKGLETNQITSVSFFLDSVYVTTLNGLFVKSKNDLLTYAK